MVTGSQRKLKKKKKDLPVAKKLDLFKLCRIMFLRVCVFLFFLIIFFTLLLHKRKSQILLRKNKSNYDSANNYGCFLEDGEENDCVLGELLESRHSMLRELGSCWNPGTVCLESWGVAGIQAQYA